eukprot:12927475-Prorocentrum_lima.AAC.1
MLRRQRRSQGSRTSAHGVQTKAVKKPCSGGREVTHAAVTTIQDVTLEGINYGCLESAVIIAGSRPRQWPL